MIDKLAEQASCAAEYRNVLLRVKITMLMVLTQIMLLLIRVRFTIGLCVIKMSALIHFPLSSCVITLTAVQTAEMKAKKKKRQDDFQKVKLKVGKKKPRADNATNTNFRSKGIYLSEQLKRDTSGPTTQKQLGINVRSEIFSDFSKFKKKHAIGLFH